jgi:hypothetical protein
VAAGKCMYILFGAAPDAGIKTMTWDIYYYYN